MGDGVLGENRKAKGVHQLGDGMVDLGVVVVGASGEHDAVAVVVLDPLEGVVAHAVHLVLELQVGVPGVVDRLVDLAARDGLAAEATLAVASVLGALLCDDLEQAALELPLVVVGDEGIQVLHLGVAQLVHVELERLRVAHHDRAVVVVGGGVVLLALPANAGHPDEVGVLGEEVHDVAVAQLGRIAHRLGGHGLNARLVGLLGGLVTQHHGEAQLGEEGVPEGIVLVHVEGAGDTHGAARRLVGIQAWTVKQELVLELEQVGGVVLGLLGAASALLAAVARDEAAPVAEAVNGQQAVVGATPAVDVGVLDLEVVDLVAREDRGDAVGARTVAGKEGGTKGAHGPGDVGTNHLSSGEKLEGAQRGVAHEGATLHHHVLADLIVVAQLDDLEQRVLDHRVGEARGDVADGGTLLLGLLHARVHEHGAAAAQVDGVLALHGSGGKLLDGHAHGVREVRDEAAAARGARLVQADVLDDAAANL